MSRPSSPRQDQQYYDTSTDSFWRWNGSKWVRDAEADIASYEAWKAAGQPAEPYATGGLITKDALERARRAGSGDAHVFQHFYGGKVLMNGIDITEHVQGADISWPFRSIDDLVADLAADVKRQPPIEYQ